LGERISENFKKAFGKELVFNKQFGRSIPICIGERLEEVPCDFKNIDKMMRMRKYLMHIHSFKNRTME